MTRRVVVAGLGTYHKWKSPTESPNMNPVRWLVWYAKDNRALTDTWMLQHPGHPRRKAVAIDSPGAAYRYAAEIFASRIGKVRGALGVPERVRLALVPLPASGVTKATMGVARWPARRLAEELERLGVGVVSVCLVNRKAVEPKRGRGPFKTQEVFANLVAIAAPPARSFVVFVDDVVTWGETLAAADARLAAGRPSAGLVIAFTDGKAVKNCYDTRRRAVEYERDEASGEWDVSVRDA